MVLELLSFLKLLILFRGFRIIVIINISIKLSQPLVNQREYKLAQKKLLGNTDASTENTASKSLGTVLYGFVSLRD